MSDASPGRVGGPEEGAMFDDPRQYDAAQLSTGPGARKQLAAHCEDSAAWRDQKARDYPDDPRNVASAVALRVAVREISDLADDDPRLLHLATFWDLAQKQPDVDAVIEYVAAQGRVIGRHGFRRVGATQTTAELLMALVHEALDTRNAMPGQARLVDED